MLTRRQSLAALAGVCMALASRSIGAQAPAAAPAAAPVTTLTIINDGKSISLTHAELKTMPRTKVEVKTEDGTVNIYEGVLVGELLKKAGAPIGPGMRGTAVASYVVASASDGYQAVFAIAELDPNFTDEDITVADTVDGKPLFAYQGPLRLVAPKDKRGARSVRMLEKIEVVRVKK